MKYNLMIDNRIVGEIYNMTSLNGGLGTYSSNGIIFSTIDCDIISKIDELINKKSYLHKSEYVVDMYITNMNDYYLTLHGVQILEYSYGDIDKSSDLNITVKILFDWFVMDHEINPTCLAIIRNSKINKLLK